MPTRRDSLRKTIESLERRTEDARDAWLEKQDRWAFRYFNDVPILTAELRKLIETRGKKGA